MDERQICRTFSIINRQLRFSSLKSSDVDRVKVRTQFYIERLIEVLQTSGNPDASEILWANRFVREIEEQMEAEAFERRWPQKY